MSTLLGLKKVIAPKLLEEGFSYAGKLDSISWVFSRDYNGVTQSFIFEKIYSNPDTMRLQLRTSANRDTLGHHELNNNLDPLGLSYEDKEGYEQILHSFLKVIPQGIDWLNLFSIPDVLPTKEHYSMLESLIDTKRAISQDRLQSNQFLNNIEKMITEKSNEGTMPPDWDAITEISLQLGESIRTLFGGEWTVDTNFQRPMVMNIGGVLNNKINPLYLVSRYWGKPGYYHINLIIEAMKNRL
ncbi:hypothetical protein [Paenibacillus glycanilyticus]|uniref:hypothetical protein n=1 Tax=Paenibacillus glycanilyticus TaxID=126569 RepID=UPI003EB75633